MPYQAGHRDVDDEDFGLRRSTSETTDRPSAVSPTTSKSSWISSRHLIASRTTFLVVREHDPVVVPEAFSDFFTVSVRSTLSLGRGGPLKNTLVRAPRLFVYLPSAGSYLRRAVDSLRVRLAKLLSVRNRHPRRDADFTLATRLAALVSTRPSGGCMSISGKRFGPERSKSCIWHKDDRPSAPPIHILVIEDHDDTRDVLDMLLRTEGLRGSLLASTARRFDKYRQRPADIVLVDIFMPRKNGIDTIRELTRDFRIPCASPCGRRRSMRRNALEFAREAGARLALRKPIEPWVLLRTLEGVVAGRRSLTRLTAAAEPVLVETVLAVDRERDLVTLRSEEHVENVARVVVIFDDEDVDRWGRRPVTLCQMARLRALGAEPLSRNAHAASARASRYKACSRVHA